MDRDTRKEIIENLEANGVKNKEQLFLVKSKTHKNASWQPIPGDAIVNFINGSYDYEHVGPNDIDTLKEALESKQPKEKQLPKAKKAPKVKNAEKVEA